VIISQPVTSKLKMQAMNGLITKDWFIRWNRARKVSFNNRYMVKARSLRSNHVPHCSCGDFIRLVNFFRLGPEFAKLPRIQIVYANSVSLFNGTHKKFNIRHVKGMITIVYGSSRLVITRLQWSANMADDPATYA
jgi:hypothetical protein